MLAKVIDLNDRILNNENEWDSIAKLIKKSVEVKGLNKLDIKRLCEESKREVRNDSRFRY